MAEKSDRARTAPLSDKWQVLSPRFVRKSYRDIDKMAHALHIANDHEGFWQDYREQAERVLDALPHLEGGYRL